MHLLHRRCGKNLRNTPVLLRFFPCFDEKSGIFISTNPFAALYGSARRRRTATLRVGAPALVLTPLPCYPCELFTDSSDL
jgi:hypothetical protein